MKKVIAIFALVLVLAATVLQSCSNGGKKSDFGVALEEFLNSGDLSKLSFQNNEGHIDSTLEKIGELTRFKTEEEVNSFVSAPCTFIEGENIYLLRKFPEDLPEGIKSYDDYLKNSGITYREIEVWSVANPDEMSQKIMLSGIEESSIVYYSIYYDGESRLFYITGIEEIDKKYIPKLYTFDYGGQLQSEQVLNIDMMGLSNTQISGGDIYYTADSKNLYRYSPEDEKSTFIDEMSAFFVESKKIYYIKKEYTDSFEEKTVLYEYDATKDTKTQVAEISGDFNIISASLDQKNDNLYMADGNDIYAYSIASKESTLVMSTFNAISTILQIFDSYMAVATGHNQITLYSLPSKPESLYDAEMPLKICYIGSVPQEAADTYAMPLATMKINGFPARLEDGYKSDDYSEYINTMAKKLLSGDDDFDLFYVTSDMSELLKSQYYLDFSSFPLLKSQYDSMLPGAKELCSIDGKLCLALTHINFNVMQQNNALTQTNHPIPKNLDEVIALKEAVSLDFLNASNNFMSGSYYHSLVEPWFDQYAANFMAKNESAEKKETLESLIETSLMLLQDKSVNIGAGRSADSYINFTQFAGIHSHNESENSSLAPVPKIDPSFKNTADSYFIAINPNSKNKQLSAAFVAHIIEYKAFMGDVVLYENENAIEDEKDYELYKTLLGDSIRSYTNTKYMLTLADQFDALVSGATTAERAADEIYEFLKLVRDE